MGVDIGGLTHDVGLSVFERSFGRRRRAAPNARCGSGQWP